MKTIEVELTEVKEITKPDEQVKNLILIEKQTMK